MKKHIWLSLVLFALIAGYIAAVKVSLIPNFIKKVDKKIVSATVEKCDIKVTTSDKKTTSIGKSEICNNINFVISKSGKYMFFEDLSGGVDLWARVYSVDDKKINTLGVWGTSSVLAYAFLDDDRLVLLTGYPNIPKEQWLTIYNIPQLYKDYTTTLDENGYFIFADDSIYAKPLEIKPIKGNYFNVSHTDTEIRVYGGTQDSPVLRNAFLLKDL